MLSQFTIKYPVLKCHWTETSKHNTTAANIKWERERGREGGRESIIHIHSSTIYSTCALLQYECMRALQQLLLMILAYKWPRDLLSWHPETWVYWQPCMSDFWVLYKNKQNCCLQWLLFLQCPPSVCMEILTHWYVIYCCCPGSSFSQINAKRSGASSTMRSRQLSAEK